MHACQAHTCSICRCFCFRSRDLYELFGSGCLLFVECVLARVSFAEIAGKLSEGNRGGKQAEERGGKQGGKT